MMMPDVQFSGFTNTTHGQCVRVSLRFARDPWDTFCVRCGPINTVVCDARDALRALDAFAAWCKPPPNLHFGEPAAEPDYMGTYVWIRYGVCRAGSQAFRAACFRGSLIDEWLTALTEGCRAACTPPPAPFKPGDKVWSKRYQSGVRDVDHAFRATGGGVESRYWCVAYVGGGWDRAESVELVPRNAWLPEHTHRTDQILADIVQERKRQHARWGEQDRVFTRRNAYVCEEIEKDARKYCDRAEMNGGATWYHILREERAEAETAAARKDVVALRKELVQTAAVAVAMLDQIDRGKGVLL